MVECEKCNKICNLGECGNSITVDFPYGSTLDNMFTPLEFCSHQCIIDYIQEHEKELHEYRIKYHKKGDY